MIASSDTTIAMPRPGSGPKSTTPPMPTAAATKSALRTRWYRTSDETSISPHTAAITMALSTACGRSVKNQVNASRTTTTRAAEVIPVTWLRLPA